MSADDHDGRCVRRTARSAALALASVCLALAPSVAAAQSPAVEGATAGHSTDVSALAFGSGPERADAKVRPAPTALRVWREREAASARLAAQAAAFAEQARAEATAVALAAARSAQAAGALVEPVDPTARADLAAAEAAILAALARVPVLPTLPADAVVLGPGGPGGTAPRVDAGTPPTPGPAEEAADVLADAAALRSAASDLFAQAMAAETLVSDVTPVGTLEAWGELGELESALTSLDEIAGRLEARPAVQMREFRLDAGLDRWINGAIPLDELCTPVVAPETHLRCDAAAALDALNAAYRADHGVDLAVVSGYRTAAEQALLRASLGSLAAPAGASNHGHGIAVDLAGMGGLGQFDAPAYRWMQANGPLFGWHHPAIMRPGGGGPQEPWHWEFLPPAP